MKRARIMYVAVAVLLTPALARADHRVAPAIQVGGYHHGFGGQLGDELRGAWGFRGAPGLHLGSFTIGGIFESGVLKSHDVARDTESLAFLGLGVQMSGRIHQGERVGLYLGTGYMHRWLFGDGQVRRRCREVGGCDGGYWTETPSYTLGGPQLTLTATWSWIASPRTRIGFALDARLERSRIELPGMGQVRGTMVSTGLSAWFGGR